MIGFYCFTSPALIVVPTMKEKIAALSAKNITTILNYFINKRDAHHTSIELGIEDELVHYIYEKIDAIQQSCRAYIRGEVIEKEAIIDVDGKITTPAVAVKPPTTQLALEVILQPLFADIFSSIQITEIIDAMLKWSKYDGKGNFAFYSTQIKL